MSRVPLSMGASVIPGVPLEIGASMSMGSPLAIGPSIAPLSIGTTLGVGALPPEISLSPVLTGVCAISLAMGLSTAPAPLGVGTACSASLLSPF